MGTVTVEQQDELFWLGRYTERVYTTLMLFEDYFDYMIDSGDAYAEFCTSLEIPNIYTSKENFIRSYCYGEDNPDSILSNLTRAHDNAIILRETIGSDALSFIQLALYNMRKAANSKAPLIELQGVSDNILSFWGIIDDQCENDRARDLIKTGRRIERVDLYARMHVASDKLRLAVKRLATYRLVRSGLGCSEERVRRLETYAAAAMINYRAIVYEVEHIFDDQQ